VSRLVETVLFIIIVGLVFAILTGKIPLIEGLISSLIGSGGSGNASNPGANYTPQVNHSGANGTYVITPPIINQSPLDDYALNLINKDREQYGLSPVTLSEIPSAQQHSDSMFYYGYFSHWDIFDMKPYMRYTLVGGLGGVSENVAYQKSSICDLGVCTGNINDTAAIEQMEYGMMYNDSVCCNNGHRDNILDPNHNQVSIGIAYNKSTIYFTEDFINNYINWSSDRPAYTSNGNVYLDGNIDSGYGLYEIFVSYDPEVQNLTTSEVPTGPYGYGNDLAGVVSASNYYYQNVTTIVASDYRTRGSSFDVEFNMGNITRQYGAGEYTLMVLLNDTSTGQNFVASTYTLFINENGDQYVPKVI
jgi:hypothetical protein